MYKIIKFIEDVVKFIRIKIKILYWKIKYGKRIKIGKRFRFRKGLIINISDKGYLKIGDNNSFNNYGSINCHKKIEIGDNNMFGESVKIYDHNHVFNDRTIDMRRTYIDREINIGNQNWFGSNCIILSKTQIGDNNVFAASTVINEKYNDNQLIKNNVTKILEKINYK